MIELPLTQGRIALIDDCDAHLAAFKWYAHKDGDRLYAQRSVTTIPGSRRQRTVILHREVLRAPRGVPVDHVNGDGLDCRRANLRLANAQQNSANARTPTNNTSGYKGVVWHKRHRRWQAQIEVAKRKHYLGMYATAAEAARAYDAAARLHFGAFAWLNFPDQEAA